MIATVGLRARLPFVALALETIALGLGVHWRGEALGPAVRDVIGDALWATMIAWWVGSLAPARSLRVRSAAALAICVVVEVSQLVHKPALDALRSVRSAYLVLGSEFDPRDLAAYIAGVLGATVLELAYRRFVCVGTA